MKLKRKNNGDCACFVLFEKVSGSIEPTWNSQRYLVTNKMAGLCTRSCRNLWNILEARQAYRFPQKGFTSLQIRVSLLSLMITLELWMFHVIFGDVFVVLQQKHGFADKVKEIKIDSERLKEIEKSPSGWVPPAGKTASFFLIEFFKLRHKKKEK